MLTPADTARLAHQALRLRENGIDSERAVRRLAALTAPPAEGDQTIGAGGGHPLAAIALQVVGRLDKDRPGPTAPKEVERLMSYDLRSIWQTWDEAVTANLEATLEPAELREWRESVARDQAAAEEHWAAAGFGPEDIDPRFGHARHIDGAGNALYDLGRQGHLDASINEVVATLKWVLVDSADYTVNLATHQFLSSVASIGRVAVSPALTTKTVTAGVLDADDAVMAAVVGDPSEALVLVQSSAVGGGADVVDTAQRLIGYLDTATGLPVTPNGGNITVAHDNGANRIFKL